MENFYLDDDTFEHIYCYLWQDKDNKKPKGMIQIIHGMKEYCQRYDEMANFFVKNGYIVFASDLVGHGKTAKSKEFFGKCDDDLFERALKDQINISKYLKQRFDLPLYVIGHSFGSFISQRYIQDCDLYEIIVLSGSRYTIGADVKLGKCMASAISFFCGKHSKATTVEKITEKSYGNFPNGNWLSRDEKIWVDYKNDEYCDQSFPISFYYTMFKGMLNNYKKISKINKQKPIMIMSGSKDPIGKEGKLVTKLYNFYNKKQLNVHIKLYSDARHEIFNETNKYEVYNDVLNFFDNK